jgi:hypothetical protein
MLWEEVEAHVDDELEEKKPNWNHHDVELEEIVLELEADGNLRADFEENAVDVELISVERKGRKCWCLIMNFGEHLKNIGKSEVLNRISEAIQTILREIYRIHIKKLH